MTALVFIDTNILLDFYEVDSGDATLPLLKYIAQNHDKIITTCEVEMEFKKNRQRIILKSLNSVKLNKAELISIPAFLRESQLNRSIKATQAKLNDQSSRLTDRAIKMLKYPSRDDPVFKTLQRFFKSEQTCHLSRDKQVRYQIRRLARKRFALGYPPRKDSDLSLVDAINWEWIIYCAQNCPHDIVVVSRDKDYGEHYGKDSILNDWLLQEFKERVSRRRSIKLTTRLTEAFKLASITVSKQEVKAEETLVLSKYLAGLPTNFDELIFDSRRLQEAVQSIDTSSLSLAIQKAFKGFKLLATSTGNKPQPEPHSSDKKN